MVAVDMLHTMETRGKQDKGVVLVTNAKSPFDPDADQVTSRAEECGEAREERGMRLTQNCESGPGLCRCDSQQVQRGRHTNFRLVSARQSHAAE